MNDFKTVDVFFLDSIQFWESQGNEQPVISSLVGQNTEKSEMKC